jgi:uncharacterized protein YegP (UPF0339 family)
MGGDDVTYYYGKHPGDDLWRWHLKTENNKVVAVSPKGYNQERDCVAAIEIVKSAHEAEVRKLHCFVG